MTRICSDQLERLLTNGGIICTQCNYGPCRYGGTYGTPQQGIYGAGQGTYGAADQEAYSSLPAVSPDATVDTTPVKQAKQEKQNENKQKSKLQQNIAEHEGKKYLRRILPADGNGEPILIDVYSVIVAFGVRCPAKAHAIKKLLCSGQRGKGDEEADLVGVLAAVNRAIDLINQEQTK